MHKLSLDFTNRPRRVAYHALIPYTAAIWWFTQKLRNGYPKYILFGRLFIREVLRREFEETYEFGIP